jgi:hypothetical protein
MSRQIAYLEVTAIMEKVCFQKTIVPNLVKKFPKLYGTERDGHWATGPNPEPDVS